MKHKYSCGAMQKLWEMLGADETMFVSANIKTGKYQNSEIDADICIEPERFIAPWVVLNFRELGLNRQEDRDEHLALPILYCPFCGKRLTDETED